MINKTGLEGQFTCRDEYFRMTSYYLAAFPNNTLRLTIITIATVNEHQHGEGGEEGKGSY